MSINLAPTRYLVREFLKEETVDFRLILELDQFLRNLPKLELASPSYFLIGLQKKFFVGRQVIGLVDEKMIEPYEFLDFKSSNLLLKSTNLSFINKDGLIDLSLLLKMAGSEVDSFLLEWNLLEDKSNFKLKSSFFVFEASKSLC